MIIAAVEDDYDALNQEYHELEEMIISYKEYKHLKSVELCYYTLVFVLALIMIATIIIINIGE